MDFEINIKASFELIIIIKVVSLSKPMIKDYAPLAIIRMEQLPSLITAESNVYL